MSLTDKAGVNDIIKDSLKQNAFFDRMHQHRNRSHPRTEKKNAGDSSPNEAPSDKNICGPDHEYIVTRSRKRIQCGSAALASGISCAVYNPLDCLRIRWQVGTAETVPEISNGIFRYGVDIVRREGLVNGLWRPGLGANVTGMGISAAIRFGWYESVRDYLVVNDARGKTGSCGSNEKGMAHMLAAGLLCGFTGYAASTPFHLLKTKIQAESAMVGSGARLDNMYGGAMKIVREGGILGLWKGSFPLGCRGALFTGGQMMGYDGVKTYARSNGILEDGPTLHITSSIFASFGASFMSAPADLLMTKYMTCARNESLMTCAGKILKEEGVTGFWRGWPLFFFRLTPVMLTYSTLYEQFRFAMGIGYFS